MTNTTTPGPQNRGYPTRAAGGAIWSGPRLANVTLGLWLFVSAFLWPHTPGSRANTWVLGLVIAGIAAVGTPTPASRALGTVPLLWLFLSSFWISDVTNATAWNNATVAVFVLALSLVPTRDRSISVWP
jgi:hypothetical protein